MSKATDRIDSQLDNANWQAGVKQEAQTLAEGGHFEALEKAGRAENDAGRFQEEADAHTAASLFNGDPTAAITVSRAAEAKALSRQMSELANESKRNIDEAQNGTRDAHDRVNSLHTDMDITDLTETLFGSEEDRQRDKEEAREADRRAEEMQARHAEEHSIRSHMEAAQGSSAAPAVADRPSTPPSMPRQTSSPRMYDPRSLERNWGGGSGEGEQGYINPDKVIAADGRFMSSDKSAIRRTLVNMTNGANLYRKMIDDSPGNAHYERAYLARSAAKETARHLLLSKEASNDTDRAFEEQTARRMARIGRAFSAHPNLFQMTNSETQMANMYLTLKEAAESFHSGKPIFEGADAKANEIAGSAVKSQLENISKRIIDKTGKNPDAFAQEYKDENQY